MFFMSTVGSQRYIGVCLRVANQSHIDFCQHLSQITRFTARRQHTMFLISTPQLPQFNASGFSKHLSVCSLCHIYDLNGWTDPMNVRIGHILLESSMSYRMPPIQLLSEKSFGWGQPQKSSTTRTFFALVFEEHFTSPTILSTTRVKGWP